MGKLRGGWVAELTWKMIRQGQQSPHEDHEEAKIHKTLQLHTRSL